MPFIIRLVAQRIIAGMIALFTFLGLSPEAKIPTNEDVQFRIEQQKQIVENILEVNTSQINQKNLIAIIDEAAKKIDNKRIELENSPSNTESLTSPNSKAPTQPPATTAPTSSPSSPTRQGPQTPQVHQTQKEVPSVLTLEPEGDMNSLADVLVNIICTQQNNGFTTASTGSGVIVSPQGVILTNAHVAQFFLLEDAGYAVECSIYRENIPTYGYKADIAHIPEKWVKNNYKSLSDDNPRGTGEDDYALLHITKNTNPVLSKPKSFSYAKINNDNDIYTENTAIRIAGFPGIPLSLFDLTKSGSLKTDNSKIREVFTFSGNNTIDIFSTDTTPVAARGASGGGIFIDNTLVGITVTISKEGSGSRINAITTTYINGDLKEETGVSLSNFINKNLSEKIASFQKNEVPALAKLLASQI